MEVLKHLKIDFTRYEHPPLHSVEDIEKYGVNLPGLDTKNLFLVDKKTGRFVLVTMQGSARMRISDLQKALGLKKLSFASTEQLLEVLGVPAGTVSILCLLEKKPYLLLVIDEAFKSAAQIGFHPPGDNTQTLVFDKVEFAKILDVVDLNFKTRYMNFSP